MLDSFHTEPGEAITKATAAALAAHVQERIIKALECDADELANIRGDSRLLSDNIEFQTNKVAIHAATQIVASASIDGSPFAWLNGNTTEWDRWKLFSPDLPLRGDQLCQASDAQLVKLLEFPIFFYLLIEHFRQDFAGLIDQWPPNAPMPRRTILDHQLLRNRGLETVCRSAATLLRAHVFTMPKDSKRGGGKRTTRRRKRRTDTQPRPLTLKQTNILQLVSESNGDTQKVADDLHITRQAVEKSYKAGLTKLGKKVLPKLKKKSIPMDERGQDTLSEPDGRMKIKTKK